MSDNYHQSPSPAAAAAASSSTQSPSSSKKRGVPIEYEPLADLEKGTMSDDLWKELQEKIQFEAHSVQVTGVIIPSPNRKRGSHSPGSANQNSTNNQDRSLVTTNASGDDKNSSSLGGASVPRFAGQRFPAMESFFQSISTLQLNKSSHRGLAMLHNAAQLGVWHSQQGGANAQLRAQAAERAAEKSEAIDESLRNATERARLLRDEQARELADPNKEDTYLKDLQRSRIDAEFERMRDQLRAEDAARREQLDYAREQKAKAAAEEDLAARKRRLREDRERRHKEREERQKELQQQEQSALTGLQYAVREHGEVDRELQEVRKTTEGLVKVKGAAPTSTAPRKAQTAEEEEF